MDSRKRSQPPPSEDGSDGDGSRRLKRWRPIIMLISNQVVALVLSSKFANFDQVQEELQKAFARYTQPVPRLLDTGDKGIRYQLQIQNDLPEKFYTRDQQHVKIQILDTLQHKIVDSGPLSMVKVKVAVLHGDSDDISWSDKDVVAKIRNDKESLLKGKQVIRLNNGVGSFQISLTDISKWARKHKFRLGVKLHSRTEDGVQEGISKPFQILPRGGKCRKRKKLPKVMMVDKLSKPLQTGFSTVPESSALGSQDEAVAQEAPSHQSYATPNMVTNNSFLPETISEQGVQSANEFTYFKESNSSIVPREDFQQYACSDPNGIIFDDIMIDIPLNHPSPTYDTSIPESSSLNCQVVYHQDTATNGAGLVGLPNVTSNELLDNFPQEMEDLSDLRMPGYVAEPFTSLPGVDARNFSSSNIHDFHYHLSDPFGPSSSLGNAQIPDLISGEPPRPVHIPMKEISDPAGLCLDKAVNEAGLLDHPSMHCNELLHTRSQQNEDFTMNQLHAAEQFTSLPEATSCCYSLVDEHDGFQHSPWANVFDPSSSLGWAQIYDLIHDELPMPTNFLMQQLDDPVQRSACIETKQLHGNNIAGKELWILPEDEVQSLIPEDPPKSKWFKLISGPKFVFFMYLAAFLKK